MKTFTVPFTSPWRPLALASVALVLAVGALVTPSRALADHSTGVQQWQFGSSSQRLLDGVPVRLENTYVHDFVVHGERAFGINLVWRDASDPEWTVRVLGASAGSPVRYNRRVALYNERVGKYVVYGHRPYGINLIWSESPRFEWSIRGLDGSGDPLTSSSTVTGRSRALFNHTVGKYVVYGPRNFGINLVWASSL
jgi:hypothetical protein